ncbi:MAG: MFS transporter, partial [Nannocystaceae bacterium]|nr:MFS transporter [Nannocystaceae bacterium]
MAWSAAQFGLLMAALYVVRPLRDELGIRSGVDNMQWLFSGTFVAMLLLVPVYALAVSRRPRRVVVPWVFVCIALTLVLARVVSAGLGDVPQPVFAAVLFVWISAFNLFAVSVFWSLAVDVFSPESSRRNFGLISAGGTLGALCGPILAAAVAHWLVPDDLLLLCAALLLGVAVTGRGLEAATHDMSVTTSGLGGGVSEGFVLLATQPRLRALCGYLLCMTWVSTVLYFEPVSYTH